MACKPGFVWSDYSDATTIHLGYLLPSTSSNQPEWLMPERAYWLVAKPRHSYSVLLPVGFT